MVWYPVPSLMPVSLPSPVTVAATLPCFTRVTLSSLL